MLSTTENAIMLAIIQGILFVVLVIIVYFIIRKRRAIQSKGVSRSKNLVEQHMVLEAISACVNENDFDKTVAAIGRHAAEVTDFSNWLLWLLDDNKGDLKLHAADKSISTELLELLKQNNDPDLYSWVRKNVGPVSTGRFLCQLTQNKNLITVFDKHDTGLMIPFHDGDVIQGFIILLGAKNIKEQRSEQFLSLFGAFAAIILKKSRLDQRQNELRQKQLKTENLASLGQLAAGLAHEIRTPLTLIKSATQHLNNYYDYEPQDQDLAKVISQEINRINQQIQDLLTLGQIAPAEFSIIDLKEILIQTHKLGISKAVENEVNMSLSLPEGKMPVLGKEELLTQLFRNLILNAIDAMESGGELEVTASMDMSRIRIRVADSGSGIPQDVKDRIFEPFFTTKESGTGLGLAVSFNIARAHGGELALEKSDSSGSTFLVILPTIAAGSRRYDD